MLNKSAILENIGKNEEALQALDQALSINLKCTECWLRKGRIFRKIGRDKEAIWEIERAIAVTLHDPAALEENSG